jgi:cobalt-precorrin 5A hydrolase/precorrin-3B C17-methyltransferase
MNVLSISLTARGREAAARLPFETVHGSLAANVADHWESVDGFVIFAALGVAVRVAAPLLGAKQSDPAVVCVDESGRWVIAVTGGHRGANDLAHQVAALLDATAIVTTATDATRTPALDNLPGFVASGDVAGITRALLDGAPVGVDNRIGWPLPPSLDERLGGASRPLVIVTDGSVADEPDVAVLRPRSLVVGIGASSGAPTLVAFASSALADAGLSVEAVATVATLDRKGEEPAIVELAAIWGVPLRTYGPDTLAGVTVPNPSVVVSAAVGTPSVAEAAALVAAGPGGSLVVAKQKSATATVAIARRAGPSGRLSVVGLGPGGAAHRTPAATAAVRHADVLIGYGPYVDQVADIVGNAATVIRSPIGAELDRAQTAVSLAAAGQQVALVCSGDAGVYALATLVFEVAAGDPSLDIDVVPGVTAALASAARLGAPLAHDHASISLSDLLTPWPVIEQRLRAVAAADMVVSLYNPRSAGRDWQLGAARDIFLEHRKPDTPVGVVSDATRPDEQVVLTTLGDLQPRLVGMTTCVIIGSSTTRVIADRMVTPRGYVT